MRFARLVVVVALLMLGAAVASARAPVRPPYGTAVSLETAKKLAAGARAEAK